MRDWTVKLPNLRFFSWKDSGKTDSREFWHCRCNFGWWSWGQILRGTSIRELLSCTKVSFTTFLTIPSSQEPIVTLRIKISSKDRSPNLERCLTTFKGQVKHVLLKNVYDLQKTLFDKTDPSVSLIILINTLRRLSIFWLREKLCARGQSTRCRFYKFDWSALFHFCVISIQFVSRSNLSGHIPSKGFGWVVGWCSLFSTSVADGTSVGLWSWVCWKMWEDYMDTGFANVRKPNYWFAGALWKILQRWYILSVASTVQKTTRF